MTNAKHVTLALMEGEISTITVEQADAGEDLVLHAPIGPMTARAVSALRRAYPTNRIVESKSGGSVIHGVQTQQDLAALQAVYANAEK